MTRYPSTELSLGDLFKLSIRLHYLTLKHAILFILLIAFTKYFSVLLINYFSSMIIQTAIFAISTLMIVYFVSIILLSAHHAFADQPMSLKNAIKNISSRVLTIGGTFVFYIVGIYVSYWLSRLITLGVDRLLHEPSVVHGATLIITTALTLVFVAMFFFCFPIAVIEETSIPQAFLRSAQLTDKNKFGIFALFFIFCATVLLLTPGMMQEYLLATYHLNIVFDFVVLCVTVPLFINLLLLVINDTKLAH